MKFTIEYSNSCEERLLTYINNECSFNMIPRTNLMELELVINTLSLTVLEDRIIQVSGFCGLNDSMSLAELSPPSYSTGLLKVEHNLEKGFSYRIFDQIQPIYISKNSDWVCFGAPSSTNNNAVEFIKNCIAVISENGKLLSLWLKPIWK